MLPGPKGSGLGFLFLICFAFVPRVWNALVPLLLLIFFQDPEMLMVCTGFGAHTGLEAETQTSSLSESGCLLTEGSPEDKGVSFSPRGLHGRLGCLPGAPVPA